jgi:hypothetical protein
MVRCLVKNELDGMGKEAIRGPTRGKTGVCPLNIWDGEIEIDRKKKMYQVLVIYIKSLFYPQCCTAISRNCTRIQRLKRKFVSEFSVYGP